MQTRGYESITLSFIVALYLFVTTIKKNIKNISHNIFDWISFGELNESWAIKYDRLSIIMSVIIFSVSFIVFVYSIGYFKDKNEKNRFFWILSLFVFCMMMLVLSGNFMQLFFGWECVGITSYLLIGLNQEKKSASIASIKAFLINRAGDISMMIGILMTYSLFKTFNFDIIESEIATKKTLTYTILNTSLNEIDIICILLFIGCMAKSAQFGLHVWLPDAMEGPTPVSALIHSATMVTAGIFLIARCSFMFATSKITNDIILIIGTSSALIFAIMATAQNDIKKIIAYSTCSQLGYMFMACGTKNYTGAIFHLLTNAYIKSLLFLTAGIFISICGTQNIDKMNNVYKKTKIASIIFIITSLSLIGIFPFSGYYSKEHIMISVYSNHKNGLLFFTIGSFGVFFTAIYMTKIIIKTFYTQEKENTKTTTNKTMLYSSLMLFIMMFLSILIIKIGITDGSYFMSNRFHINHNEKINYIIKIIPTIFAILGIISGAIVFKTKKPTNNKMIKYICNAIINEPINKIYNKTIPDAANTLKCSVMKIDNIIDKLTSSWLPSINHFVSYIINTVHIGSLGYYLLFMIIGLVICIMLTIQ